ncbi:MAG: M56 family metallopeptidase [Candidatus Methanomethylicia archaeon]
MMSSTRIVSRTLDIEIGAEYIDQLEYIVNNVYLESKKQFIDFVVRKPDPVNPSIIFRLRDSLTGMWAECSITIGGKPTVSITVPSSFSVKEQDILLKELEEVLYLLKETGGYGKLYFTFTSNMELTHIRTRESYKDIFSRLFFNNLVFVFALSIVVTSTIWFLSPDLTRFLINIMLFQAVLLLLSDRIVFAFCNWRIDELNRYTYLVECRVPLSDYQDFLKKCYVKRTEIKKDIFNRTLALKKDIDFETVRDVLLKYGFEATPQNTALRKIDVYSIVKKTADKCGLRMPKRIGVLNIAIPNAGMSGTSFRMSTLMVTTGAIATLTEDEMEAVLAHEFSHLRRKDQILFFILSSIEYISRIYLIFSVPIFLTILGWFYLFFSLTALFFIAKFIETRADTDAAYMTGNPKSLASALRRIGTRRILMERDKRGILMAWLRWDPHPPVTFRIRRLETISINQDVKIWRKSIADCIRDFINSVLNPKQ